MANFHPILIDHYIDWSNLRPLTLTKPISYLRIGIEQINQKWERLLEQAVGCKTATEYLSSFNTKIPENQQILYLNAAVIPTPELAKEVASLELGESLYRNGKMVASMSKIGYSGFEKERSYNQELAFIQFPWDIFALNGLAIDLDFQQLTKNNTSQTLSDTNILIGDTENLFIEEGAQVEGAILNVKKGPIYIGKNAEIMEGCVVRGPFAMCESAILKLSAKIYGPTTLGPHSKVGGEVNNSVIQGYSNKGHDGFLGNSVIGEWCNLGADTNNSNLKNNYSEVKAYNYEKQDFVPSGRQFLGLVMGDHSKCGINTMFNTGTVVGVFANIFGSDFPPKYIPSYSWGGAKGFDKYDFKKALEVAQVVMERRSLSLSKEAENILNYLYQQ